jgi:hypothetical protein
MRTAATKASMASIDRSAGNSALRYSARSASTTIRSSIPEEKNVVVGNTVQKIAALPKSASTPRSAPTPRSTATTPRSAYTPKVRIVPNAAPFARSLIFLSVSCMGLIALTLMVSLFLNVSAATNSFARSDINKSIQRIEENNQLAKISIQQKSANLPNAAKALGMLPSDKSIMIKLKDHAIIR